MSFHVWVSHLISIYEAKRKFIYIKFTQHNRLTGVNQLIFDLWIIWNKQYHDISWTVSSWTNRSWTVSSWTNRYLLLTVVFLDRQILDSQFLDQHFLDRHFLDRKFWDHWNLQSAASTRRTRNWCFRKCQSKNWRSSKCHVAETNMSL